MKKTLFLIAFLTLVTDPVFACDVDKKPAPAPKTTVTSPIQLVQPVKIVQPVDSFTNIYK